MAMYMCNAVNHRMNCIYTTDAVVIGNIKSVSKSVPEDFSSKAMPYKLSLTIPNIPVTKWCCVFSLTIYRMMIVRIPVLYLNIIVKSEVWPLCLRLRHETMLCTVSLFIYSDWHNLRGLSWGSLYLNDGVFLVSMGLSRSFQPPLLHMSTAYCDF